MISISQQIVEDLTRTYRQSDYSLTDPEVPFHLALTVLAFSFALRAGIRFHQSGAGSRIGRVLLRSCLVVAVPLIAIGIGYLLTAIDWLIAANQEPRLPDNIGLAGAHVFFATCLTGASVFLAVFSYRRLRAGRPRSPDQAAPVATSAFSAGKRF